MQVTHGTVLVKVKAANKLLKTMMPHGGGCRRVDGVPVFSAQNLDIAIATSDGIKWYILKAISRTALNGVIIFENNH